MKQRTRKKSLYHQIREAMGEGFCSLMKKIAATSPKATICYDEFHKAIADPVVDAMISHYRGNNTITGGR